MVILLFLSILAHTLSNLACANWYHNKQQQRLETIPKITKEKEQAKADDVHTVNYFKEAIEKLEKLHLDKQGIKRNLLDI